MFAKNCIFYGLVVFGLVNFGSSNAVDPVSQAPANTTSPAVPSVNPVTSQTPAVSTVTAFPSSGDYCKGHKTGDYVIDPQDSHVYYECVQGRAIKFTCPISALQGRLVFDPVKKVCTFPPEA